MPVFHPNRYSPRVIVPRNVTANAQTFPPRRADADAPSVRSNHKEQPANTNARAVFGTIEGKPWETFVKKSIPSAQPASVRHPSKITIQLAICGQNLKFEN